MKFTAAAMAGVLVTAMLVVGGAGAAVAADADEVVFADAALKSCVTEWLGIPASDAITEAQMASMSWISCSDAGITDVAPLAHATGLTFLALRGTQVSDLSPIAGLTGLTALYVDASMVSDLAPLSGLSNLLELSLNGNQVRDLSPLSGLNRLTVLSLSSNLIDDVSPLSSLPQLVELALGMNQLSDLSPLSGLTALKYLWVESNELSHLSGVSGLTSLEVVNVADNRLVDVSALSMLPRLSWFSALGQVVAAPGVDVGVAVEFPVISPTGAAVPLTVTAGDGTVTGSSILWGTSGQGEAAWSMLESVGASSAGEFSGTVSFTISSAPVVVPASISGSPPDGAVGADYAHDLVIDGGPMLTVRVSSGAVPPGLALSESGSITGVPSAPGTYRFEVTASDGVSADATAAFTVTIAPATTATITQPISGSSTGSMLSSTGSTLATMPIAIGVLIIGMGAVLVLGACCARRAHGARQAI